MAPSRQELLEILHNRDFVRTDWLRNALNLSEDQFKEKFPDIGIHKNEFGFERVVSLDVLNVLEG